MMQIHSHLLSNEIIGFLAGYNIVSDKNKKQTIVITEAYPCKASELEDSMEEKKDMERNVELSPESA